MSDYNWCHGPCCHTRKTTSRVRGVKGSKVLRTMKINSDSVSIFKYFCDHTCMHDFIVKHIDEFARLHPRPTPLETPIEVSKETSNWYGHNYTTTKITPIDNMNN